MTEHGISFSFQARYFKLGEISPNTEQVWFVLHGQGQLASFFIRKFRALQENKICVIAPEGLSHYYLDGYAGRVGSTWMTKENRLMDIENYIQYLNTIYIKELTGTGFIGKTTLLGFSQGAATASRWAMDGKINFNRLILWGGIFPPDMDFEKGHELLNEKETYLVYGKSDPFLTDDKFAEMRNLSERLQIKPIEITFDGQHDIDEKTLLSFIH